VRSILAGSLFALLLLLPMAASRAGLDTASVPAASNAFELVVVEAEGCIYCRLFRRDVLPAYRTSEQGKEAPVRFVDVNDVDKAQVDLTSPVDIVPTFVVLKARHEVGRISGYVGPENFFHSINYLLASAP
jgi:thioredoxin-related protein